MIDDACAGPASDSATSSDSPPHNVPPQEGPGGSTPPSTTPIPPATTHYVTDDSVQQCEPSTSVVAAYIPPPDTSQQSAAGITSPGMVGSRKLAHARRKAKHLAAVARIQDRLWEDVHRKGLAILRAPEVAASGPQPGMTPTEVRIARDSMMSSREAPMYLGFVQRMIETKVRADTMSERDPAPRLNVETIQVAVTNTYVYEHLEDPSSKR